VSLKGAFDHYAHPNKKVSGLNVLKIPFREVSPKMVRAWSNPESLPLLAMGGSDGLPVAHAKYFRMRISPDEQI
jgi:hypothetical protein